MPQTNTSNIIPSLGLTFEDTIDLLLTLFALEEIDQVGVKDEDMIEILLHSINFDNRDSAIKSALIINKSVDDIIENIMKLQVLLQRNLDKISDKAVSENTESEEKKPDSFLIGNGEGIIANCSDEFYCKSAFLKSHVSLSDTTNRKIQYSVKNNKTHFEMEAHENEIEIDCPSSEHMKLRIHGKGEAKKTDFLGTVVSDTVHFLLIAHKLSPKQIEFKMEIKPDNIPELNHYSGFINNYDSDLRLEICPQ